MKTSGRAHFQIHSNSCYKYLPKVQIFSKFCSWIYYILLFSWNLWWRYAASCNVFSLEICFLELSPGYNFPIDPSLSVFIPRESRYEMYFCEYCIYSEFIQTTKHNKDELVSFQKHIYEINFFACVVRGNVLSFHWTTKFNPHVFSWSRCPSSSDVYNVAET